MNFKEIVQRDIMSTFFNVEEFGEKAIINEEEAVIVMDNEMLRKQNAGKTEGLAKGMLLFHIQASFFKNIPQADKLMKLNGDTYKIEDVKEEEGVLAITLGRYSG